ncbi:hypothetical protein JYT74_02660 [Crocinitomix catalasitica]|nr:hypothetical protein [Crocinitomix catalasitica]
METTRTLQRSTRRLSNYVLPLFLTAAVLFIFQNLAFSEIISEDRMSIEDSKIFKDKEPEKYRVFLGHFADDVPMDVVEMFWSIGNVKSVRAFDGSYSFYSEVFKSEMECEIAIEEYKNFGAENMSKVIEVNGEIYSSTKEYRKSR